MSMKSLQQNLNLVQELAGSGKPLTLRLKVM
jgi:hypothetical protein